MDYLRFSQVQSDTERVHQVVSSVDHPRPYNARQVLVGGGAAGILELLPKYLFFSSCRSRAAGSEAVWSTGFCIGLVRPSSCVVWRACKKNEEKVSRKRKRGVNTYIQQTRAPPRIMCRADEKVVTYIGLLLLFAVCLPADWQEQPTCVSTSHERQSIPLDSSPHVHQSVVNSCLLLLTLPSPTLSTPGTVQ